MLFTSFEFIFAFLPVAFLVFFLFARFWGREAAALWLAAASLFFYGWWSTTYIALLLSSILFNYCAGYLICKNHEANIRVAKTALYVGIVSNLALLCYYKYTNFFLGEISRLTGAHIPSLSLILPLGISFFTFTQIAFLVDTWKGKAKEYNFSHYILFVTWFPHLIAGPILHHGQMMPQFKDPAIYKPNSRNIAIGIAIFSVGLGKKLLLADPISTYADPLFHAAATGQAIGTMVAWAGAMAYTLQIYFDFSGYSDMAVGLSLLFGIRLPVNFNSPYKAKSIIEFWRRWHMTLSQFLRDYLYIPLGGNRKGEVRRLVNLSLTMLLGGLWHGASWTFIIWGGLHGAYLCANHIFQKLPRSYLSGLIPRFASNTICVAITFAAVIFAWVFFRAENVHSAIAIAHAMLGSQQSVPWDSIFKNLSFITYVTYLLVSMFIIWVLPNIYEVIDLLENRVAVNDQEGQRISSTVCVAVAMTCVAIMVTSLLSTFGNNITSPFLYFQF